jgi:hypothetical protein
MVPLYMNKRLSRLKGMKRPPLRMTLRVKYPSGNPLLVKRHSSSGLNIGGCVEVTCLSKYGFASVAGMIAIWLSYTSHEFAHEPGTHTSALHQFEGSSQP